MSKKCRMKKRQERQKFWEHHIKSWEFSKLSQNAYCREHNLKTSTFRYWRQKISACNEEVSFLPIPLAPDLSTVKNSNIRIHTPNGFIVEVENQGRLDRVISMVAAL